MKKLFILSIAIFSLSASVIFKPLEEVSNYNKDVVNLGKKLFFEKMLSKNNDISCNSCHHNYGADDKKFSIGDKKSIGFINTPSLFNPTDKIAFFWNGRSETLKEQIVDGPLFNTHEMASSKEIIEKRLNNSKEYLKLFKKVYGSKPTLENTIDAIVQFEKTLVSTNSKFDKYLRGEVELTKKEKEGLELFKSYGCVSCHNGINIGGNSYQKFGSIIDYTSQENESWEDRFEFTKDENDKDVYRVPSLRDVAKTAPYFHNGDAQTLQKAVYTMAFFNIGALLKEKEIDAIVSFLNTLTGELPKTYKKEDNNE